MHRAFPLLMLIVLLAPPLRAADLSKVDRSIGKEPAYQSKTPRYGLLVFGPEAKTRVWFVLDGKTLYVDRNANGDLTEEGEKITAKKGLDVFGEDGENIFEIGEIHEGPRTHKNVILSIRKLDYLARQDEAMKRKIAQAPQGRGYSLFVDVDMRGFQGEGSASRIKQSATYWDAAGFLVFAERAQDAPILHFGGPRLIRCTANRPLMVGRETDVTLAIMTPGLGAGTTVHLAYVDAIPEAVHPRVEILFPSAKPGEPPLRRHYELKERC